jgi:hypothetical protein
MVIVGGPYGFHTGIKPLQDMDKISGAFAYGAGTLAGNNRTASLPKTSWKLALSEPACRRNCEEAGCNASSIKNRWLTVRPCNDEIAQE